MSVFMEQRLGRSANACGREDVTGGVAGGVMHVTPLEVLVFML